ncbi:uncharacterized protein B0I36DRAFT_164278 [Microdochium trichocladiopsis]|uniref:Uncharacterized protein n=1 Tax=Microdochium trichocladiopsis TaxID=1682393 RepID=A0A9P8XZ62_9PEZI|nr:uncharacterized protein B0I36DRAFT_164278 [Microdochium trichocladiopsis]KAH7024750.1 hypothetical protein B0I36DRAFT_164278 [Microdochium trichocladiopsis]
MGLFSKKSIPNMATMPPTSSNSEAGPRPVPAHAQAFPPSLSAPSRPNQKPYPTTPAGCYNQNFGASSQTRPGPQAIRYDSGRLQQPPRPSMAKRNKMVKKELGEKPVMLPGDRYSTWPVRLV